MTMQALLACIRGEMRVELSAASIQWDPKLITYKSSQSPRTRQRPSCGLAFGPSGPRSNLSPQNPGMLEGAHHTPEMLISTVTGTRSN